MLAFGNCLQVIFTFNFLSYLAKSAMVVVQSSNSVFKMCFGSAGDFQNGKRTGVTLFLGDVFELHLSVDGRLSQGEKR